MKPTVTFTRDTTGITLPAPKTGAKEIIDTAQVMGQTAGGTNYTYDLGTESTTLTLDIHSMTDTQKNALSSFFSGTADGMKNSWVYQDAAGTEFTARFLEPSLVFTQFAHNIWDCTVRLSVAAL